MNEDFVKWFEEHKKDMITVFGSSNMEAIKIITRNAFTEGALKIAEKVKDEM